MGFLLNGQPISADRAFTDAQGTQYPRNWLRLASDDEKAAIGITWEDEPLPYNSQFYSGRDENGELIPQRLDDEAVVDADGNAVLDDFGDPVFNYGLRREFLAQQKRIAAELLAATDWYVTRKAETDAAIPADVLTYRAAVRTISGTRESEINACATVAELEALMTNPAKVYDEATDSMVASSEPFITPWPEQ